VLPQIMTEEATKNALIMPFIQVLGYDVFNPFEVTPEFIADLGIKKGEKVDYVILNNSQPVILIECKHHLENLDPHSSQLFRYFSTTKAKFGLLTNGINYRFYTDLLEPNKMDEKPFFEFNITEIKDNEILELRKFHKSYFDLESIVTTASVLKYSNEIKNIFSSDLKSPSAPFVKYFISQVYDGKATEKVIIQFTDIVRRSLNQHISDAISERLKSALDKEAEADKAEAANIELNASASEGAVVTTEEELEAFMIVKSIIRSAVSVDRIFLRDAKTYCSVILDDNNRKPICRFWLNATKKSISLFDSQKNESKIEIARLDDIFLHADTLIETVSNYKD
jgi:predicted type IV restriction endonuclease